MYEVRHLSLPGVSWHAIDNPEEERAVRRKWGLDDYGA